ncbi:MAG TPA: hypothetical protein VMK66_15925, partial [Myxococcales bacterium]|nr:hypothetical protein [Myxococcales bacterium]
MPELVPEKLRALPAEAPAPDPMALKTPIAERVRADSRERRALTPEHVIQALDPRVSPEGLSAVLAVMGAEVSYADIKGIVAPSGRIYLFSLAHLTPQEAREKAELEETKWAIAGRIRADSRGIALTSLADLDPLFPAELPAEGRAALLAGMEDDERFKDLRRLTGPGGETFFHCETSLTGTYGGILVRAKTKDACYGI